MLRELPDADDVVEPEALAGPDHPMRAVTRQVAFEDGWSPGRAAKIADLFDSLSAGWTADHSGAVRVAPLHDALRRGGLDPAGRWLELGSGTGVGTVELAAVADRLVAVDLSAGMLANATDLAPRVRADASVLPFPDAAFDVAVLVNMLLFPAELCRVLSPGGKVVWVNTLGDRTPIHLPPPDVIAALPGDDWQGVTARAGSGFWAVFERPC
ncbi:MAG: class I SAM-dependent methyltransferase [Acidimicrobiales bacterium]